MTSILQKSASCAHWLRRLVRHIRVSGQRGSFVCVRGVTHQCTIRGVIYDSPFHAELAYRIDYTVADTGQRVTNAEIPTDSFLPNAILSNSAGTKPTSLKP